MPFQIIRNDITRVKADVIVNTANPHPVVGGGTDSAIYHAAGEDELLKERVKIGDIAPGQAAITPAFRLSAKYIIHTVGPAWVDGKHGEREILHSCYSRSLALAAELEAESIAFPLISTGVYGFPKDEALDIALDEIGRFLLTHNMDVTLVVFDRKAFMLSRNLVSRIDEYIDEHGVGLASRNEYGELSEDISYIQRRRGAFRYENVPRPEQDFSESITIQSEAVPFADMKGKSLDEILGEAGKTFQEKLFDLIKEKGIDEVEMYKRANIGRKVFSRIRCNRDYKPKKRTAVACAIALKLNMQAMLDLLSRAEIAFSPSNKFDLIISYFVTNRIYDIIEINAVLFDYGQPLLGEGMENG